MNTIIDLAKKITIGTSDSPVRVVFHQGPLEPPREVGTVIMDGRKGKLFLVDGKFCTRWLEAEDI